MSAVTPEAFFSTLQHKLFPEVDVMLRRGAHIGEEDQDKHGFVRDAERVLDLFYRPYGAHLRQSQEGTYYLGVEEGAIFKTSTLTRLDMLIGKTLAAMLLEPEILTTLGRVSLEKLMHTMELHPGRATLLLCAGVRVGDEESANRRLRELIGKSLNTLADLNFIQWTVRQEEIVPYRSLLRFAGDVRTAGSFEENMGRLIADGSVVLGAAVSQPESAENGSNE